MPLVTPPLRSGRSAEFKTGVLDGVHGALAGASAPPTDRFHRVLELSAEDFRFDPTYPDAVTPRGDDFVLIKILLSIGRSVKVKRKFAADLMANLRESPGLDPKHVMVVFQETAWENGSFAGGRFLHSD